MGEGRWHTGTSVSGWFGTSPHQLTSHASTVTDDSACIDCGDCVDRCPFGARDMSDGSLAFNPDLCFGCSLCVSTCPTNAVTLVDEPSE